MQFLDEHQVANVIARLIARNYNIRNYAIEKLSSPGSLSLL